MAGIVGYGAYIPRNRIKVEEIAKVWGADAPSYKKGLMLEEKSVPSPDQDTITMAVEASKHALKRAQDRSPGDRGDLRRLGIAPLRRQAERHDPGRGARRRPRVPHGRPRVRLQGRDGGDVHRPQPRPVGRGRPTGWASAPTRRRARPATPSNTRRRPGPRPSSSARTTWSPRSCTPIPTRPTPRTSGGASTSTTRSTAAGSRAIPPISSTCWAPPRGS